MGSENLSGARACEVPAATGAVLSGAATQCHGCKYFLCTNSLPRHNGRDSPISQRQRLRTRVKQPFQVVRYFGSQRIVPAKAMLPPPRAVSVTITVFCEGGCYSASRRSTSQAPTQAELGETNSPHTCLGDAQRVLLGLGSRR